MLALNGGPYYVLHVLDENGQETGMVRFCNTLEEVREESFALKDRGVETKIVVMIDPEEIAELEEQLLADFDDVDDD